MSEPTGPGGSNRKLIGWAIVAACVALAVIIVIAVSGDDDSPEKYLRENYDHVRGSDPDSDTGIVFEDDGTVSSVANEIASGTDADENRTEGSNHYLRYDDDWLVVVAPRTPTGSTITLYEYDRGYRAHSAVIGLWGWNSFYGRNSGGGGSSSDSFRGGGSGFGK